MNINIDNKTFEELQKLFMQYNFKIGITPNSTGTWSPIVYRTKRDNEKSYNKESFLYKVSCGISSYMTIEDAQQKAVKVAYDELIELFNCSNSIENNGKTEYIYCSTENTKTGNDGWLLFNGEIIDKKINKNGK